MSVLAPEPSKILGEEDEHRCVPEHAFHCFDTLYCALTSHQPVEPQFAEWKCPLFVTWNTRSRPGRPLRLRGCIGTFVPVPLAEGLAKYALISAFRDDRFRKIELGELESLECSVSLLTDFEDADSYLDWTVGRHGISITFPHPDLLPVAPSPSSAPSPLGSTPARTPKRSSGAPKHTFSACYLPHVAPEQGWDRLETIDSAIRKAGWGGRISEDLRRAVRVVRYQSRVVDVSWKEYAQWRTASGGAM
ncbi:AMMECR1 domain-containing protein [Epithele typhae]|uniref:AMMECR1 domain-containing protein n=1 Tax=Epithele typhae TaxID=378194 RepID=UPI002007263A|nr:AMMECR1 domain-containing protein [Epithele typhae]KAH9943370.1 AMMECR1 domain-containing protein [Epithele typhae]